MKTIMPIRSALTHPDIFGTILPGESWAAWRILLIAAMGEDLIESERAIFKELTARENEPGERCEEFWAIIGRRGGKTRAIAVLAAYLAAMVDYSDVLAPGERATLPIISASLWQANKAYQYLDGIFANVPALRKLVSGQTSDTISLKTRVDIECRPASFRTVRGGTACAIIADEVAFWRSDTSANPDTEILNAIRPSLATTGGLLACISSPYARRGELYATFKRDFGQAGDAKILVAKAPSRRMNSALSESVVARAYERDAAVASAEYGGEFRSDLEAFISREAVEACVASGVLERAPLPDLNYHGFVDPSGGSADSFTLAIAHHEADVAVLDCIREIKPPFSPEAVVAEYAGLLKKYRIGTVRGDRYAGEWPREQFRKHGVQYVPADKTKSEIYLETLPIINSQRVALLDDSKLLAQLIGLERRTARSGKDSIDHAPGAHDDRVNAAASAIVLASQRAAPTAFHAPFVGPSMSTILEAARGSLVVPTGTAPPGGRPASPQTIPPSNINWYAP